MTSSRISKLLLLFALAATPFCAAQQAQDQPLQFTVRQTSQKPLFRAELLNAGKQTLHLWLGMVVIPSKEPEEPDTIDLSLTNAKGQTFPLILTGRLYAPGGLMYPVAVTLTPGASYSFPVDLEDYGRQSLAPGQYTLQAVYIGKDLPHNPPIQYWTGTVTSNPLPFTIPQQVVQYPSADYACCKRF